MSNEAPVWKQLFDMIEGPLTEHATAVANSAEFSKLLASMSQKLNELEGKSKKASAEVLHLYNVPAYTDITKLSRQIGSLTNKVETLSAQIEEIMEKLDMEDDPPSKSKTVSPRKGVKK